MSWFDATGFANLAKSALKEAQKTIDKALDIKDDEAEVSKQMVIQNKQDSSDFFASWGLKDEEEKEQKKLSQKQQTSTSIWGSFTGSFFETSKSGQGDTSKTALHSKSFQNITPEETQKSQLKSSVSLPEDISNKSSNKSIPKSKSDPVKHKEESEVLDSSAIASLQSEIASNIENKNVEVALKVSEDSPVESAITITVSDNQQNEGKTDEQDTVKSDLSTSEDISSSSDNKQESRRSETNKDQISVNQAKNRMSVVSIESDKKSLESVEVLGSRSNTDCTTTPDSDPNSITNSLSPPVMGQKGNSESVEVLPDSLVTSPSSVEILGDWKSDSSPYLSPVDARNSDSSSILEREQSVTPCGEELDSSYSKSKMNPSSSDISPYESPIEEIKTLNSSCPESIDTTPSPGTCSLHGNKNFTGSNNSKTSPDSVEVIPDVDELDEVSLAEDSYTSASESTVMTIMDAFQQFDQNKPKIEYPEIGMKMHDSCPDNRQVSAKTCTDPSLSLDSLKEKHNLHLPLQPITTQPVHKSELPDSGKPELNFSQIINSAIEPRHLENEIQKIEPSECTDQYLMLTDSSCEGTLIESSSEDNATLICPSDNKILETPLTASSYVKTMLADAMVEKGEITDESQCTEVPRENSPISSESPNGDSSSTQSRQRPAKLQLSKGNDLLTKTLKTRGHSRELSEISIGSDDTNLEIEKLLRRIQELTEILESRESKLIDISRMNMELHEQNNSLKKQLDNFEKHAEQNQHLNQITDEYTQRLSALERKFQQAIKERDSLRKNLEQLKQETATRLSSQEMSSLNAEKDEIIKELREEGEKLSKQQLQHSNIIKKLRLKEKENDLTMKNQKEQLEEQSSELERLKRSLHAKEEVERTQIEAVHTLTAKTKKQEKEILSMQEKLDNTLHKMEAYKRSLDAAKIELNETKKNLQDTEEELKLAVESAGESCQLLAQVEDFKIKLRSAEEAHVKKEEFLKHENAELLKRLEAAETRSEELSESVSVATKSLLRQVEQLQANLLHKSNRFMKHEKVLSNKNMELQTKVENLIEMNRSLKEENVALKSKLSQIESKLHSKITEKERLEELQKKTLAQNEELIEQSKQHQKMMETLEQSYGNQVKELKREINALENKLAVEKAATDAEKRKNHAILEQQQSLEEELRFSPTPSTGKESTCSTSSVWPSFNDTVFEDATGRFPMMYESIRAGSSSAPMIENLQAQLKQRDGEIQQLQWELSRRNIERDALNSELSTLTLKVEDLSGKVTQIQALNENLNDIQTRYDALLQMYGEKVEENQELRLDLEDIKEMYKSQIDQLLKRDT